MPYVEKVRALADEHLVTFACVIYADSENDYNQELSLSREQVDLVSSMGATFWADVYFLGSGRSSGPKGMR